MFDRIVNGKHFDEARKISWKQKVISENIEALDVYWFETFDKKFKDIPSFVEANSLQTFFDLYGRLPSWNKEF